MRNTRLNNSLQQIWIQLFQLSHKRFSDYVLAEVQILLVAIRNELFRPLTCRHFNFRHHCRSDNEENVFADVAAPGRILAADDRHRFRLNAFQLVCVLI